MKKIKLKMLLLKTKTVIKLHRHDERKKLRFV